MLIGVPKEIKNHEYRVGLTPDGAQLLCAAGHEVRVQSGAGERVGYPDELYAKCGAQVVATAADVYAADMVIKVKEPQRSEFPLIRAGQILYCYLHFAPDPGLLDAMLMAGASCVAYETVSAPDGTLPLLVPMSEIAGRLAPQVGAWALQIANGGSGTLLAGVPGVPAARVLIIGGGTVGSNAARIALGMGADVLLLDRYAGPLRQIEREFGARIRTRISTAHAILEELGNADLVIGAVLLTGKRAPTLIRRADLERMRRGSVIVDVGIDQGGICESSRPTSHSEPLYVEGGIVHYCVPNMPAAVARTATRALTEATLPHAAAIAAKGLRQALLDDEFLRSGLQVHGGKITHAELAHDMGRTATETLAALN